MDQPGVLTHQAIRTLCGFADTDPPEREGQIGPIQPALLSNVRSASYDLRIGGEYYLRLPDRADTLVTRQLDERQSITIAPNQLIVLRAHEHLAFDADIIGHLSLKMDLLLQGLIMASQSQVDAGYEGWIFALLYNLSDTKVTLKQGRPFLRLELVRLVEASAKPYRGDYQNKTLQQALEAPLGTSLQQMRESLDRTRTTVRRIEIGGILAFALAVLPVFVVVFIALSNSIGDANQKIARLDGQLHPAGQIANSTQASTVKTLCIEIRRLERLQKVKPGGAC